MHKLVNKIIAPIAAVAIAVPAICISTTSCRKDHVEITKIKLSSRYQYIYPNSELKIKAEVFPSGASKDDIEWEVISSIEGFTISDNGKLFSPDTYPVSDEPVTIQVKATSKTNPEVSTLYSILATTDTEHELLGFTGGFQYMDRGGNTVTKEIKSMPHPTYQSLTLYYLDGTDITKPWDPANQDGPSLYAGRQGEFFNFQPVFKTGRNKGMKFELYNYKGEDIDEGISWVGGYEDGTPTNTIPQFLTLDPTVKHQIILVNFTCDEDNIVFWIYCNIYQNTNLNTPAVFGYSPSGSDKSQDKHDVFYRSEGVYASQILCPTTTVAQDQREISTIYLYRKPYEEIENTLWGKWVKNENAPDIFVSGQEPAFTDLYFDKSQHLPDNPDYLIASFSGTYQVDANKLVDLDYENYLIGTYFCYDTLDPEGEYPVARLDFWVEWIDV